MHGFHLLRRKLGLHFSAQCLCLQAAVPATLRMIQQQRQPERLLAQPWCHRVRVQAHPGEPNESRRKAHQGFIHCTEVDHGLEVLPGGFDITAREGQFAQITPCPAHLVQIADLGEAALKGLVVHAKAHGLARLQQRLRLGGLPSEPYHAPQTHQRQA